MMWSWVEACADAAEKDASREACAHAEGTFDCSCTACSIRLVFYRRACSLHVHAGAAGHQHTWRQSSNGCRPTGSVLPRYDVISCMLRELLKGASSRPGTRMPGSLGMSSISSRSLSPYIGMKEQGLPKRASHIACCIATMHAEASTHKWGPRW